MKIATISDLKAKLARYIRLVKSGEEVEIHERGIPVARLTSIHVESDLAITLKRNSMWSIFFWKIERNDDRLYRFVCLHAALARTA